MQEMKRRLFLISLAISPIFFSWPIRWLRVSVEADDLEIRIVKYCLSNILTDQSGARLIGKVYLSAYPDERNKTLILKDLLGPTKFYGPEDLKRRIAKCREQDFLKGEVVVVDGWILARSEARAAALTVLL
jgi:hypothetical protein